MTINDLPDFPAIKQIADALWSTAEIRGAAVLVGAGFSRSAAVLPSPTSRKPPLWIHFSDAMRDALYPSGTGASSDPLKLAEEYKAALGATALDSLICDLVRDEEWRPGPLHSALVNLPWADVLTTNWDTLLERASQETDREDTYDIVRTIADIPRRRSPRIAKLHGSMPSYRPFIFTEEDYRTYPRKFAPFVNLVQQVLMENELCLLGFSGEDPNFLQWSGWIRDQLGDAARRIYLVGVLNLSPAYRKYLEARKVTPVDLAYAVAGGTDQHTEALAMFLDFLRHSKPRASSQWLSDSGSTQSQRLFGLTNNDAPLSSQIDAFEKIIDLWHGERQAYGGWLVCPFSDRLRIRSELGYHEHALRKVFEHLRPERRAQAMYETAWRVQLVFYPLSQWFQQALASAVQDSSNGLTAVQRNDIEAILAGTARDAGDRSSFEKWITLLRQRSAGDKDAFATAAYEECLWARDHLDYAAMQKLLVGVSGEDPIWKLRRAALLFELGETERATALVMECRNELRERFNRDHKSIWTMSRHAWAIFVARAAMSSSPESEPADTLSSEEWPHYFVRNKCLPWDELDHLDREISEEFRRKAEATQKQQPTFEPGSYTETVHFSASSGWAMHETAKLADIVGLPLMLGFLDLMRSRFARALALSDRRDDGDLLRVIRALRSSSDKLVERAFSRIEIARMPLPVVQHLSESVWKGIDSCRVRHVSTSSAAERENANIWVERMGILLEVLSRLVVRVDSETAAATFRRVASLTAAPDLRYWALFDPLGRLLDRSLSAVSPSERELLLAVIINIPLPDEIGIQAQNNHAGPFDKWPEPMVSLVLPRAARPANASGFPSRIAVLISRAETGDKLTRERAIIRLFRLFELGILTDTETALFAGAFWAQRPSADSLPQNTGLLSHVVFKLPAPHGVDVTQLFRSNVLGKVLTGLADPVPVAELVGATHEGKSHHNRFELTAEEALRLFRIILDWQPRPSPIDLDHYNDWVNRHLGLALINAVMPALPNDGVTAELTEELLTRLDKGSLASPLIALPDVVRTKPAVEETAVTLIHRACFSNVPDDVMYGLGAIDRWRILKNKGSVSQLPRRVTEIGIAVASWAREPWLSSALSPAQRLLVDGHLKSGDTQGLTARLGSLIHETAYSSWDTSDARTITITQIRQRCVRLAEALRKAGFINEAISYWLEATKTDPLPEVRYALTEQDD
jgi:hypothetical protein